MHLLFELNPIGAGTNPGARQKFISSASIDGNAEDPSGGGPCTEGSTRAIGIIASNAAIVSSRVSGIDPNRTGSSIIFTGISVASIGNRQCIKRHGAWYISGELRYCILISHIRSLPSAARVLDFNQIFECISWLTGNPDDVVVIWPLT